MTFNRLRLQLRTIFIIHGLVTIGFFVASFFFPFLIAAAVCNLFLWGYNYTRFKRQITEDNTVRFGKNWVIWSRSAAYMESYEKRPEFIQWCNETIGEENFQRFGSLYVFRNKNYLLQAKLMWGGILELTS